MAVKLIVGDKNLNSLASILEASLSEPTLLLVSGGSALAILNYLSIKILGKHLTVAVLDERFNCDEKINNFSQLKATDFYHRAKQAGTSFIDTYPIEKETLIEFTERYERALKQWSAEHPGGLVWATFGIGEDGHTAGIMPYPEDEDFFDRFFVQTDRWVVGYNAGSKNIYPDRATVTINYLLNQIDGAVGLVMGEAKRGALKRVLAPKGSYAATPARVWPAVKNTTLFTDQSL